MLKGDSRADEDMRGNANVNLGNSLWLAGKHEEGLETFQTALKHYFPDFEPENIADPPDLHSQNPRSSYLEALYGKALVLEHLDVSPENMIVESVDPLRLKTIDFGVNSLFFGESVVFFSILLLFCWSALVAVFQGVRLLPLA